MFIIALLTFVQSITLEKELSTECQEFLKTKAFSVISNCQNIISKLNNQQSTGEVLDTLTNNLQDFCTFDCANAIQKVSKQISQNECGSEYINKKYPITLKQSSDVFLIFMTASCTRTLDNKSFCLDYQKKYVKTKMDNKQPAQNIFMDPELYCTDCFFRQVQRVMQLNVLPDNVMKMISVGVEKLSSTCPKGIKEIGESNQTSGTQTNYDPVSFLLLLGFFI